VFETLEVNSFVVGDAIAPAHEHDALPFKGEGADRGRMSFTTGDLILDKYFAQAQ
jgi:hypothetical protein